MNDEDMTKYIETIFDHTENVVAKSYLEHKNEHLYLNDIFTPICRDASRFIENYLYDFMLTWNTVLKTIKDFNQIEEETREIYTFGMRKSGCDDVTFLLNRLESNKHNMFSFNENFYRRIYAIEVKRQKDDRECAYTNEYITVVTLKNIQCNTALIFNDLIQK